MTLENLQTDMPVTEDSVRRPLPAYDGRIRCRSIYDAAVLDSPIARRIIQTCADAGEQARLAPNVPMKEGRRPHHRAAAAHPARYSRRASVLSHQLACT